MDGDDPRRLILAKSCLCDAQLSLIVAVAAGQGALLATQSSHKASPWTSRCTILSFPPKPQAEDCKLWIYL